MLGSFAPIVLFTYNRLWHTRQTVEALGRNEHADKSDLIIFSDAPKTPENEFSVQAVRQFLKTIEGFQSVRIVEREQNLGLAKSIIIGVGEMVNKFDRVIVMEDDLITSPFFLRYMNEALIEYQDDDRVISIHGYCYPIGGLPETFFLKGADCWGWATWKRGWNLFESDGRKLLAELIQRNLMDRFDMFGGYRYSRMLKKQITGKNDSWAIRWYAAALLQDKLTLYPGKSLVHNTGNDASGHHCATIRDFDTDLSLSPVQIGDIAVEEHSKALNQFHHFLKQVKLGIVSRVAGKIKQIKGIMAH